MPSLWVPPTTGAFAHSTPCTDLGLVARNPFPSACLTSENAQELVVSVAKLWLCGPRIGYFHPLPIFVPLGAPSSHSLFPPPPWGPVRGWAGVWDSRREVVGDPMAPLRNPQPAPETSSRSQQEPADLAAASKGGGMKGGREGGREAARDQNEITARERGWLGRAGRGEGGVQLSRTGRAVPPMGVPSTGL